MKRPRDLYAIVSDLVLDRVSIKDESRSDRCSPVGTKSVAIDKFKCNQGRPRFNKSDTIATTMTASATTKFCGNTYMILHLEARKEAIAPHVLQQRTKKFATQIRRCYIAVQKQPTLVWSLQHLSIATHDMLMQLRNDVAIFPTNCNTKPKNGCISVTLLQHKK